MSNECDFDCCHIRIVKFEQKADGAIVGFETVCLKNNSVRIDEIFTAIEGDTNAKVADAWQQVAPLINTWNAAIVHPTPSIIGKTFDPESLLIQE